MPFSVASRILTHVALLALGLILMGCNSVLKTLIGGPFIVANSFCQKNWTAKLWSEMGTGTATDPYVICTAAQFASLGKDQTGWSKNFALGTSIDLKSYDGSTSALTIKSIGTWDYVAAANNVAFTGTFDGQGNAIQNLTITAVANQGVGPFGYISKAFIHDLKITNLTLSGGKFIGGLSAANKSSLLRDISVQGKITGTSDFLAGLVASNDGSGAGSDASITRAVTKVDITGIGSSGGLAGIATFNSGQNGGRADVTDSSASGSINMTVPGDTIGGFVAYNIASAGGSAKFTRCFSTGDVVLFDRGAFSGTFIGTNTGDGAGTDVSVTRSYSTGSISSNLSSGGGLGGLVGINNCSNGANCSVTGSYVRGNVTVPAGANNRGGIGLLIGSNNTSNGGNISITDSYAIGLINIASSGAAGVGGLVGNVSNDATTPITVDRSYVSASIAAVAPGSGLGALFGSISNVGATALTVTNSYWNGDLYTTGSGTAITGITSKTTAQLNLRATFPTWDFATVWSIKEGVSSPTL